MAKRLYRSNQNRVIAGVCGGLGEYFDIDPVIIRIILLILFFAGGIGLIAYIVAWIIIPTVPVGYYHDQEPSVTPEKSQKNKSEGRHTRLVLGIIFIIVGILFGLDRTWYGCGFLEETMQFLWRYLIPLVLIIAGIVLISREKQAKEKE